MVAKSLVSRVRSQHATTRVLCVETAGTIETVTAASHDPHLLYDKRDGVALLTMNAPDKRDALSPEMLVPLAEPWRDVRDDDGGWGAVLTSASSSAMSSSPPPRNGPTPGMCQRLIGFGPRLGSSLSV
jgi:hypothetical protein